MPRVSKDQLKADRFRSQATEMLKDRDWLDEGVRHWLEKELLRKHNYFYTENEHAALSRVIAASTLFAGWDGYSVTELLTAAYRFRADGDYEDERIFAGHKARNATELRLGEMQHLVGFCRNVAGLPLAPFRPEMPRYEEIAQFHRPALQP
jgi:hypothetical protein